MYIYLKNLFARTMRKKETCIQSSVLSFFCSIYLGFSIKQRIPMNACEWYFSSFAIEFSLCICFSIDRHWEFGYYPFPEMNRFLNSYAHIHSPAVKKPSMSRTMNFQDYICKWVLCSKKISQNISHRSERFSSMATNREHMEEIVIILGEEYRPLIKTIIQHDCLRNKRSKRRLTINIPPKKFWRKFLPRRRQRD